MEGGGGGRVERVVVRYGDKRCQKGNHKFENVYRWMDE